MHIERIHIKNFKSFEDVIINCNSTLNVFTGVNNAGKTTVLEAISLWLECFNTLIYETKTNRKNLAFKKGDFIFSYAQKIRYKSFEEVDSVRSPNYESIFFELDRKNTIKIAITLIEAGESVEIPFKLKAGKGMLYEFLLDDKDSFDYGAFNNFFQNFPHPISIIYASPIAALQPIEDYVTIPKIKEAVRQRNSTLFLRNRLVNLYNEPSNRYQEFLQNLSLILNGTLNSTSSIQFDFLSDFNKDVRVIIKVKLSSKAPFIDLSMVGSGTLQIIEILLAMYQEQNDFNIILLDEPDSHIHRDIQKRLFKIIAANTYNTQVFGTTHNESLIRSLSPKNLFHLQRESKARYKPIYSDNIKGVSKGLQPSYHIKILESLGSESALDLVNAIEADKLILVEGRDDAQYIQAILDTKYINNYTNIMYWSFKGVDEIFENIKVYQTFFKQIKNTVTLWDKSVLVFDKDKMTQEHKTKLGPKMEAKLKIPIFIWNVYTIEASILTEIDKFVLLLSQYFSKVHNVLSINISAIQTVVETEIKQIAQNKLKELEDNNISDGNYHWLKNRREKLVNRLKITGVFESDGRLQPVFNNWAKNKLNTNQIEHLATKDDVHQIIKSVAKSLSLTFEDKIDDYFENLIRQANFTIWFKEWDNMIDTINQV